MQELGEQEAFPTDMLEDAAQGQWIICLSLGFYEWTLPTPIKGFYSAIFVKSLLQEIESLSDTVKLKPDLKQKKTLVMRLKQQQLWKLHV